MIDDQHTHKPAELAAWAHVMATGFLIVHGDPENQRRASAIRSIAEKARRIADPHALARIAYAISAIARAFDESAGRSAEELTRLAADQKEMDL